MTCITGLQQCLLGLVVGAVAAGYWPALPGAVVTWSCVGLGLALLSSAVAGSRVTGAVPLAGCLLGLALAQAHGRALLEQRLQEHCVRQPLVVTGRVLSLPQHARLADGTPLSRFTLAPQAIEPAACSGPRRIQLSSYAGQVPEPGQRWRFEVLLRKPWGMANPGGFNRQAWLVQRGVDAEGSVRGEGTLLRGPVPWYFMHQGARLALRGRIDVLPVSAGTAAVLRALTIGDKSAVGPELAALFRQLGVSHLLVVSGLHVGLVAGLAYLLCAPITRWLPGRLSALPGLAALLLASGYAALAGFSLPTQRALAMLACVILAGLAGRKSVPAHGLLVAAAVVLVLNPLASLGSGFWLSFGAVLALLWIARWQGGASRWRRALRTHALMALCMLPLGAAFFQSASLIAAAANLVLIPLVGGLVVPLALIAAVASLLGWSCELPLWLLAAWPLEGLLSTLGGIPLAEDQLLLQLLDDSAWSVFPAALAVVLLCAPTGRRLKLLALLLITPLWLAPRAADPLEHGTLEVTVLDVGQGTAVVVQGAGRTLLYDTGGGAPPTWSAAEAVVLPYLRRQGVGALDTLIISHPDQDHSAGIALLQSALPASRVRYGGRRRRELQGGIPCRAGEAWRWPGGQVFRLLSPGPGGMDNNNSSCVLQIEAAGHRLLLAGDIERKGERALVAYWGPALASDWLLVPHHGSRTSSSITLLKHVDAKHYVVSAGYANRFGHPHDTVSARLEARGTVWETATGGALTFRFTADGAVSVAPWRSVHRRFWM